MNNQRRTRHRRVRHWLGYWLPTILLGIVAVILTRLNRHLNARQPTSQILILMIEHIGDVIVSMPFLACIRSSNANAHIAVITSRAVSNLLETCPYVDEIIVVPEFNGWWDRLTGSIALAQTMRSRHIEIAIVPKDAPNEDFNELICLFASCQKRITRSRPQFLFRVKPLKFFPFYDRVLLDNEVRHESEQRLRLGRLLNPTYPSQPVQDSIPLTAEDVEYAEQFLLVNGLQTAPRIVAFGIGAAQGGRRWPLESYARVIDHLHKTLGVEALLMIGPSDTSDAKAIARLANSPIHYATDATLRQSLALLKRCVMFIGNDSGPMHMASIVGIPVVEISAHPACATPWSITSPERFGPTVIPHRILRPHPKSPHCRNGCRSRDDPHCITNIKPATVIDAAMELVTQPEIPKYGENGDRILSHH